MHVKDVVEVGTKAIKFHDERGKLRIVPYSQICDLTITVSEALFRVPSGDRFGIFINEDDSFLVALHKFWGIKYEAREDKAGGGGFAGEKQGGETEEQDSDK